MVPWIHMSQSPDGILINFANFAQLTYETKTDSHTALRATSVTIGHIYALRADITA